MRKILRFLNRIFMIEGQESLSEVQALIRFLVKHPVECLYVHACIIIYQVFVWHSACLSNFVIWCKVSLWLEIPSMTVENCVKITNNLHSIVSKNRMVFAIHQDIFIDIK